MENVNILEKKIKYEEQDIIIDPRSNNGEDINSYFQKNNKIEDTFAKNLKAKTKKIFDQDYDLEKCEIIDLDKNSSNKIINMIFKKKTDPQYLEYLNTLTKEGHFIEEEEFYEKDSEEVFSNKINTKCNRIGTEGINIYIEKFYKI